MELKGVQFEEAHAQPRLQSFPPKALQLQIQHRVDDLSSISWPALDNSPFLGQKIIRTRAKASARPRFSSFLNFSPLKQQPPI
jgi:hypothetical protein